MLRLYLCKGFNNLLEQDDKGDVSAETTGPAPAEVSAGIQISAERLLKLLSAETCTPSRLFSAWALNPDYSDPIAGLIEFPFLPRPRISVDVCFSAYVFSAPFWVSSFGAASVKFLSLRFCCLCVPPRSLSSRQMT
ncbi:hypothetical protein V6N12_058463 [Hibiscus sabdariffa]|uniref:Uncharacterized protein n=1 Tax=Hibiscus sabdariffa TaxID=183260 RepID=A0ABR2ES98_9ROSI